MFRLYRVFRNLSNHLNEHQFLSMEILYFYQLDRGLLLTTAWAVPYDRPPCPWVPFHTGKCVCRTANQRQEGKQTRVDWRYATPRQPPGATSHQVGDVVVLEKKR